jgi:hypothetical protein
MALMFSILIAACFFMIGYGLNHPPMIAIAKEELAAFVFTVMIIFFWISLDSILNTVVSGLLISSLPSGALSSSSCLNPASTDPNCVINGLTTSHLSLAIASLDILETKLVDEYLNLYLFEALIGFLSTISFPIGSPIPAVNIISLSLAPFTGLGMLSTAHTIIVEAIGHLLTVVWAKGFMLLFSRDAVPLLLLPLGLIVRAFPFFRKTGSSIIAICFALYFAFPFAVLLSNYMIFDIFQPTDFTYNPDIATAMHTTQSSSTVANNVLEAQGGSATQDLYDMWNSPSVIDQTQTGTAPCAGSFLHQLLCSASNLLTGAYEMAKGILETVYSIWHFMVGMTGDFFFTFFNNPALPPSASAGLFHFLILEVTTISPIIILIMVTTVLEIIITVTAFRSVSLMIGGEAELIGLTKVI